MSPEKQSQLRRKKTALNQNRSGSNRSRSTSNTRGSNNSTTSSSDSGRSNSRSRGNITTGRRTNSNRNTRNNSRSQSRNRRSTGSVTNIHRSSFNHKHEIEPVAILNSITDHPILTQPLNPPQWQDNIPPAIKKFNFPPYKGQKLKVMIMGGNEEVGRNMTILEYENDIIIIDMGLQFPEESMPGIDYVIPNISYLKGKEKNIRGVIITHGHYDHIGGISHIMPQLGNPPMFMGKLAAGLVKARHEEFKGVQPLNITLVDTKTRLKLGQNFYIEFCHVTHTIPECFGIACYTPVGMVFHTGDFKLDFNPVNEPPADIQKYAELGNQGVLALLLDSTNAMEPGHQLSEKDVAREIEKIFVSSPGRIIIGTFASLLSRVQIILALAEKYNKRVLLEGRTMKKNVEIAYNLGFIKMKPGTLVLENEDPNKIPDNKLIIMGTGAQAQERAFLTRFANDEHRTLSVKAKDTIVFSSSVVPGNERTVSALKDTFARKGAKVIHYKMMDVHAGGHAKREDIKLMLRLMTPQYVVPIEQSQHILQENADTAASIGIDRSRIFVPLNGQIMEFTRKDGALTNKKANTDYVFVDGLGVGDQNHVVLRDRQMMSQDGMLVIIATVDRNTGALVGSPDIVSRGFVYMKENQKLIEQTRNRIKKILSNKDANKVKMDDGYIKGKIRNDIGDFLYKKTKKRPMVLPVIMTV